MKMIKLIFIIIAIAAAVTLVLNLPLAPQPPQLAANPLAGKPAIARQASRFLQQKPRNPRAADHCNKDNEACIYVSAGTGQNTTCCNNKCIDLLHDSDNCGACKKKCEFTESCCRGECVTLTYDKRHCGSCNNRCMPGGYCIYGMCDYA